MSNTTTAGIATYSVPTKNPRMQNGSDWIALGTNDGTSGRNGCPRRTSAGMSVMPMTTTHVSEVVSAATIVNGETPPSALNAANVSAAASTASDPLAVLHAMRAQ